MSLNNLNQTHMKLDIEVYEEYGENHWAQCRFLVHGYKDVLWTNSIDEALEFIKDSAKQIIENVYKSSVNSSNNSCLWCKHWKSSDNLEGSCLFLSGDRKTEMFPEFDKTGIDSTPLCVHDGSGFDYDTKHWFSCIHFELKEHFKFDIEVKQSSL